MDKKSSLKWHKKAKEENGPEKYVGSWESHVHVAVQLRFRLMSGFKVMQASQGCLKIKRDAR